MGLRVKTDHPLRGDLRMTLVSPQGTRSILQRFNSDTNAGPSDWTYYSTHHFYESSAGTWTFDISDEYAGATGSVLEASLILRGVDIMDADQDGLDDAWEMQHFNSLSYGPLDDPDAEAIKMPANRSWAPILWRRMCPFNWTCRAGMSGWRA